MFIFFTLSWDHPFYNIHKKLNSTHPPPPPTVPCGYHKWMIPKQLALEKLEF